MDPLLALYLSPTFSDYIADVLTVVSPGVVLILTGFMSRRSSLSPSCKKVLVALAPWMMLLASWHMKPPLYWKESLTEWRFEEPGYNEDRHYYRSSVYPDRPAPILAAYLYLAFGLLFAVENIRQRSWWMRLSGVVLALFFLSALVLEFVWLTRFYRYHAGHEGYWQRRRLGP